MDVYNSYMSFEIILYTSMRCFYIALKNLVLKSTDEQVRTEQKFCSVTGLAS